jgi:hypothetical protein
VTRLVTTTAAAEFRRDGFTVIRGFLDPDHAARLCDEVRSARTRSETDLVLRHRVEFRNNLYFGSKTIRRLLASQRLLDVLVPIAGTDLWVRWDQAVSKPGGAGTFAWHQDNAYSRLVDAHVQVWFALTASNAENGGLHLEPRSHRHGLLEHRRSGDQVAYAGRPRCPVSIEAEPGDIVVFSSFTLHSTTPNDTSTTRWAYVAEYLSLRHVDPTIDPPYFVVARHGVSAPEFVDVHPAADALVNRLKYGTPARAARRMLGVPRHVTAHLGPRRRRPDARGGRKGA